MALINESLDDFRNKRDEIRFSGKFTPSKYNFETRQEKKKREANEFILNHAAYLGTFANPEKLIDSKPQLNDFVLRSSDGQGSIILFNGDLVSEEDVNELKTFYKIDQGLNYLDARPITYKRWLDLPEDRKMASRIFKDDTEL